MDAAFEKELSITRMKAAGLNHRTQSLIVVAELLSEYIQLVSAQQKQIDALAAKIKDYEDKSADSTGRAIPTAPPTTS
jgi:hypothetical protein